MVCNFCSEFARIPVRELRSSPCINHVHKTVIWTVRFWCNQSSPLHFIGEIGGTQAILSNAVGHDVNVKTKLSGMCVAVLCAFPVALIPCAAALADESAAHLAIENPAELSKDEASALYRALKKQMDRGYATAHLDQLMNYQSWPLYNDAPYISATHGQRYVNSYANRMAHNYGTLTAGDVMPRGSVLAKDSMTVTDEGKVYPGALFVMEKLPEGASPETADWRYIMVMPDGSLFGDTMGDRADSVAYCHRCHEVAADRDYTFFVPEEYRTEK